MESIFAKDVDIAQMCLDLKRDGFCTFELSENAKELRHKFLNFAEALLSNQDTTGFTNVLKTDQKVSIRLETDDRAKNNGAAYPNVSTAMTDFFSCAFKEILYKINIFGPAKNIAFINGNAGDKFSIVDMIHYPNAGEIGIVDFPELNDTKHRDPNLLGFSLGSTGSGLELYKNGKWVKPNNDHGIIWAGNVATRDCNIPAACHRVTFTKGVARTTLYGDLCETDHCDVFAKTKPRKIKINQNRTCNICSGPR